MEYDCYLAFETEDLKLREMIIRINDALKILGLRTTMGDLGVKISKSNFFEKIDNAQCIVMFLTESYLQSEDLSLSGYIIRTKGRELVIPVSLEKSVRDSAKWIGRIGSYLKGKRSVFIEEGNFGLKMNELVRYISNTVPVDHSIDLELASEMEESLIEQIGPFEGSNSHNYDAGKEEQTEPIVLIQQGYFERSSKDLYNLFAASIRSNVDASVTEAIQSSMVTILSRVARLTEENGYRFADEFQKAGTFV